MNFKIVGGGIAGLASALAVSNSGHDATVFERAVQYENAGAGLQLGPNAVFALQQLGAWDAVKPFTFAPQEIHIRDGKSGKILKRLPLGETFEQRYGLPYLSVHRADLHRALLEVVKTKPNIELQTDAEVSSISSHGFSGLIAADGVFSKMRELMFPDTQAATTQDIYFRGLINLPTSSADIDFACINLWLYSGGHVVHYPVGSPLKLNLIAITQGESPMPHFQNASSTLQGILNFVPNFIIWKSAYVSPLKKWNQNNITLIGDAAHGTLPYLAQGAAMALEDAAVLSKCIIHNTDIVEIFTALFQIRNRRTTRLQKSSMISGKLYHLESPAAQLRNAVLRKLPASILAKNIDWVYNWKI